MLIVGGIFKNNVFVPDRAVSLPDGTRAVISVQEALHNTLMEPKQQKKAWHDFFAGIKNLDEELSPEFDKILGKDIRFTTADFS